MSICERCQSTDHKTHRRTNLFRPPADFALFVAILRDFGEKETIEEMYLALALCLCPRHEHGTVKVDDFVV